MLIRPLSLNVHVVLPLVFTNMTDSAKKDENDGDPRLEFISNYATKSLRLKSDKWPKMVGNEEHMVSNLVKVCSLESN